MSPPTTQPDDSALEPSNDATPGASTPGVSSGLAAVWDRLLSGEEEPHALGLTRVLVVAVLMWAYVRHAGGVVEYYSDASILGTELSRELFHERFSWFRWAHTPKAAVAVWVLGLFAHVAWLVGWRTSLAAIVAMSVTASLHGRNPWLIAYPDRYALVLGVLLALMPSGRGFSLDARRIGDRPVPVWCRRLLQVQIAILYTATGLDKSGVTWRGEGTAIYYTLVNPYNRHFDIATWLAPLQPWVLRPMTWFTLVWEVAFGGFVAVFALREASAWRNVPDLRWLFLGYGVLMHLGIALGTYVMYFSALAIAAYAAFLTPEEARRCITWLRTRRSTTGAEAPRHPSAATS